MAANLSTLSTRQIENALRRGAKTALVAGGMQPSTRRGNKELTLAVQRLAQQPYSTLAEATQAGAALGQTIVELSQAKGKTNLAGGIVRQMMLTGEIPTVAKATAKPAKTKPVVVDTAPPAPPAEEAEAAADTETRDPAAPEAVEEERVAEAPREAIASLESEALGTAEAEDVPPEAPPVPETLDSEMADAPGLAAIETLEPAAIEAAAIDPSAPEPSTAAETDVVPQAEVAQPEAAGRAQ